MVVEISQMDNIDKIRSHKMFQTTDISENWMGLIHDNKVRTIETIQKKNNVKCNKCCPLNEHVYGCIREFLVSTKFKGISKICIANVFNCEQEW